MTISRNFDFMENYDRRVGRLAGQAERYVYSDPESCLFKLRLMVETMARTLIELQALHLVDFPVDVPRLVDSVTCGARIATHRHADKQRKQSHGCQAFAHVWTNRFWFMKPMAQCE